MDRRCIVVIPAYNEADTIEEVASRAARHADVCVVDDASTDETGEIAERLERVHCIRHPRNTHIAGAILDGFRYALAQGYDACITMDAGMSHDPDALPLFQARTEADLVIGYRERRIDVPWQRRALSAAGTTLMNLGLAGRVLPWGGAGLRDCTSGYRLYSRRAVRIARGSGREQKEVHDLVKRFDQMKALMRNLGKQGGPLGGMPGLGGAGQLSGASAGGMDPMAMLGAGSASSGRAKGRSRARNSDARKKNKRRNARKSRRNSRR